METLQISDISPCKISLMTQGLPTNSFTTDISKSVDTSAGNISESQQSVNETSANALESAATIAGSGIVVATMIQNAGSIAAATQDIMAAAVEAMTTKVTEILTEYATKFAALPLSIPGGIESKTMERFNKSKGEKDASGSEYDPVKLSLEDLKNEILTSAEKQSEEQSEKQNEEKQKNAVAGATEKLKKVTDSANKILAKSSEVISKIMTHAMEGPIWLQEQIDKEVNRAVQNVTNELETAYQKVQKDIDTFCTNEGNKRGTQLVKQYNDTIRDNAKSLIDKQNEAKTKANIATNAAIQKVKLQLFALIGL